jgi:glycosyltransferase involved in cell wall biosynthesis
VSKPRISVVIPTYERAQLVCEAIRSVLRQTFTDFELVVVDDGSTDRTADAVASFRDDRIRFVPLAHGGRCRARNAGAAVATGEALVFLDSDDRADPNWLRSLTGALTHPVALVCCGARFRAEPPRQQRSPEQVSMPYPLGPLYGNRVGLFLAGTFAVRRQAFQAVGGYDPRLAYAENSELGIRLTRYCEQHALAFAALHQPLISVRLRTRLGSTVDFRERLEAAELIVRCHADRQAVARSSFANYRAIAAVNAYRLGRYRDGMRHFVRAAGGNPGRLVHWKRLMLALVPPLARRFWTRQYGW